MSNHTKGPWSVNRKNACIVSVYGPDGKSVCSMGNARSRSFEECMANAQLAAAAPELLEAVKQAYEVFVDKGWGTTAEGAAVLALAAAILSAERKENHD